MIELNRLIFHDKDDFIEFIDIEKWMLHDNKLYRHDNAIQRFKKKFKIFNHDEMLKQILKTDEKKHIIF